MASGDKDLLFRPELASSEDKPSRPFFWVPAWWRRFIYHVLKPREVTVYDYYLSVMNKVGVAFPVTEQIAEDLGLSDREGIRTAQARLVETGFLLQPTDEERQAFQLGERPIYQRPCVQYTIRTLLSDEIDGELYPRRNRPRTKFRAYSDSVVAAGIHYMLGDDAFALYQKAAEMTDDQHLERLTKVLAQLLDEDLDRRREEDLKRRAEAVAATFAFGEFKNASDALRKIFESTAPNVSSVTAGEPARPTAAKRRRPKTKKK